MSALFKPGSRNLWGDYGSILVNGDFTGRDEATGRLLVSRVGPFVPPLVCR